MNILSIVGTRPQFIKCTPITRKISGILVHTGQHYDYNMSDVFFDELNIPKPDYNLGVGSASHGEQTGKMLIEIEKVLLKEQPDLVLVYGDTNSTLAGAVAAAKLHIKVAHVESGLRSFDRSMPEEINRILTDHCSDILFCPTQTAVNNLCNEGITQGVYLVGDVMLDALNYYLNVAKIRSKIIEELGLEKQKYIVVTVHRAGNTDSFDNMRNIIEALGNLGMPVVFPIHPRTEKQLAEYGLLERMPGNVIFLKPFGYLDMLMLMVNAWKILTDSGGIQKEAYMLGIPCVTMRDNTEWVETLEGGWNVLVGADKKKIVEAVARPYPDILFGCKYESGAINRILNVIEGL